MTEQQPQPQRPPEPALFRAGCMLVTTIAAIILGRAVSTEWVETATMIYGLVVSPMIAAWLTRRVVSPTPEYQAKHRKVES